MKTGGKIATGTLAIIVVLAVIGWLFIIRQAPPGDKASWDGVDVTVIQKFASAAGREARAPFINTSQGDLLLFAFALGGAVGGFTAGYYWRKLFGEKRNGEN